MSTGNGNQIYTRDEITYKTLIILKNQLILGKCVLRQFDDNFGVEGAKIGDTLRIRIPPRYQSTSGPAPTLQGTNESYKIIQANNQTNIAVNFSSKDLAVALDNIAENLLQPVAAQIASDVDGNGMLAASVGYSVNNTGYFAANYAGTYAGFFNLATPGGFPSNHSGPVAWVGNTLNQAANSQSTAAQVFQQARARLMEQAAPAGDHYAILSPAAMGATVTQMFTNFNPQSEVSELYRTGLMGNFGGARFYESQNAPIFTSGTWSQNGNVNVTAANGSSSLTVNLASGDVVVAGDQFVVDGIFAVNPLNRLSTGSLQVFVATANATANAAGAVVIPLYPPMYSAGQPQTITALPTAGQNVVFQGTSNTSTVTNLYFQKNAIALAIAPLSEDLPGAEVSVAKADDIMLRYVKQYIATTDLRVERFDVLYGWAVVRPELGCLLRA